MKILLLAFTVLFFIAAIYPQRDELNGIKFNSENVQRFQRTSLFLNDNKPIELQNSFSISFDISFWDLNSYGPILRIEENYGNEIRVIYKSFESKDSSNIYITLPSNDNFISIKLLKKRLLRNKWFNLKLIIDKQGESLIAEWDNLLIGKIPYQIKKANKFLFTFGIKDFKNPNDFDVPAICIKNILITENNIKKYYWDLNPFDKDPLADKISDSKINVINPVWLYSDHQKWKLIKDILTSGHSNNQPGLAYDSINSKFFIDGKENLIVYDLILGKDSLIKYKTTSPAHWNDLSYDENKQLLYSYFTARGEVSVYNLKKNEWEYIRKKNDDAGYYFGSTKFIYPNDGKLYLLGGYGYYRTKKDLFSYDFVKKDWQIVKLKKNEMTPRAWFTFGKAFNDGEYFIYGGFGNDTGNQELGFNSYYDLFVLNMNDSTITKLKLPKEQKFSYSYLFNNLYLDTKDSSIYFLSMKEESKSFTFSLNKLDLKTGDITTVGNKFWETNEHSWLYASLNYSKSTNEFITAIFFNGKYELFSIKYPPVSETLIPAFQEVKQTNHTEVIIFAMGGIFLIILVIVIYNKRKGKSNKIGEPINSRFNIDYSFSGAKNSIRLFGGFHLYDKDSKDISASLSPKLKEIFLLLLIKSFSNHRGGITSEELSSTIWPDASPESAKTNRGVAINKIRKFLSNVEGITIEFSDKLWQIKINNSANCDYAEYLKYCSLFKAGNTLNGSLLNSVLNVLAGGEFLRGVSYEWLDSIKFAINIEVIGFLKSFLESPEIKNDPEKIVRICDTILQFDIVEQDALKIKLRTLTETGKIHIAKSSFNLFVADYKKLYDENFPLSFEEFISS